MDTGSPSVGSGPPRGTGGQGEKTSGPRKCEEVGAVTPQVPGRGSGQNDAPEEKEEKERH